MRHKKPLNILLIIFPLLFLSKFSFCQSTPASIEEEKEINLTSHLEILADPLSSFSITDAIQKKSENVFLPFDSKQQLESDFTYWVHLQINNKTENGRWILSLPFLGITHGNVFYKNKKQDIYKKKKIGSFERRGPDDGFLSIGEKYNLVLVDLEKEQVTDFYIQLRNEKKNLSPTVSLSLIPHTVEYIQNNQSVSIGMGFFFGLILLIGVFSFLVYWLTGDSSYSYYTYFLFVFVVWAMFSNGIFRNWCIDTFTFIPPKYIYLLRTLGSLVPFFYLKFIWSFGDLNNILPNWKKYFNAISYFIIIGFFLDIGILLFYGFNFVVSNAIPALCNLAMLIFIVALVPMLYKRREESNLKFILAAIIIYIITLIIVLIRLIINDFHSIHAYEAYIAQTLDIIIFTTGLAKKYQSSIRLKVENQEIKNLLEDREILLKEIHHRVKNNLQVVSSLLSIQSRKTKDKLVQQAINESKSRVHSMSLIHQNLYAKDNLRGIDMKDYLTQLSQNLFKTYNIQPDNIQLKTSIDSLLLDVETVVPIGLITNELVSNTLKHAFPNDRKGNIFISLKEENNQLLLRVKDNGVGMKDDSYMTNGNSFGVSLIRAFLVKLDAELDVKNDDGTDITLAIKKYVKL